VRGIFLNRVIIKRKHKDKKRFVKTEGTEKVVVSKK
jgi:hypothetical protein